MMIANKTLLFPFQFCEGGVMVVSLGGGGTYCNPGWILALHCSARVGGKHNQVALLCGQRTVVTVNLCLLVHQVFFGRELGANQFLLHPTFTFSFALLPA